MRIESESVTDLLCAHHSETGRIDEAEIVFPLTREQSQRAPLALFAKQICAPDAASCQRV